jgi:hypothetical protein
MIERHEVPVEVSALVDPRLTAEIEAVAYADG